MYASASVAVGRREHPGRADEQVGVRAVEPVLLGTGHRVTADEAARELRARLLDLARRSGAFTDPTSVTTGAPASSASITSSATCPTGTATIDDVGAVHDRLDAAGDVGDRAHRDRARPPASGSASKPTHLDPGARQREADRASDEAGTDERDPAQPLLRQVVSQRLARLRGTRGGARRGLRVV